MSFNQLFSRTFAFLFMIMLFLPLAVSAQTDDSWVEGTGTAAMEGKGREAALNDALRDAQRTVVGQVLGTLISSETLVEQNELIHDRILAKVEGYVKKHEILDKSCQDSSCVVKIKAQVERMALADDVAALAHVLPQMNYPTVVVSFTQKSLDKDQKSVSLNLDTVEQTITARLVKKGFRVAEVSALMAERLRQSSLMEATGNKTGKALEEASFLSQVVIAGQAVVQDNGSSPYNERIHSYSAFLTAKVFENVTGRMLASASADASLPHQSYSLGTQKAAQKAAEKLGDNIASSIIKGWLDACYNEHEIVLILEGVPFSSADELRSALMEGVKGVSRVNQKSYLQGRMELAVGWQNCNTARLAQLIHGLSVGKSKLQVVEARGNSIRVKFQGN